MSGFVSLTITSINGSAVTAVAMAFPQSSIKGLRAISGGVAFEVWDSRKGGVPMEYQASDAYAAVATDITTGAGVAAPGQGLDQSAASILEKNGAAYAGAAKTFAAEDILMLKAKGTDTILKVRESNGSDMKKGMIDYYLIDDTVASLYAVLQQEV